MNLPRRIDDILKDKQALIDKYRDRLNNSVIRLQSELFEKAVSELIPQLDIKDGIIQDTANNYKVISQVDKIYEDFNKSVISEIFPEIAKGTEQIAALNNNVFNIVLSRDLPPNFEAVLTNAKKLMDARLGIDYSLSKGPRIVRGSFLYSMLKDTGATEFKQLMLKNVTAQVTAKEFISSIKENIVGGEEKYGSLTRKLRMYTYDLYQQYDAAYNVKLANEFGLKWFIYQGGLVDDSRDFCREHNNHVYSIDETESWKTWTPRDAVNITEFTQKDLDKVPSYLDYPGYDPLVDRGGYNCRHQLGFITDELAEKMKGKETQEPETPKEYKFESAKTIDEATQRIKDAGVGIVKLEGLSLDYINSILNAVESESFVSKFKLDGLVTYKDPRSFNKAVYSESNNRIFINLSKIKTNEKLLKNYKLLSYEEQLAESKKSIQFIKDNYQGKPNYNQRTVYSRINAFENQIYQLEQKIKNGEVARPYTVSSEIGSPAESMRSSIYHEFGHYRLDKQVKNKYFDFRPINSVSEYGRTNNKEYFAEWYSQFRMHGTKGIPKDLLEIFNEL